MVLVLPEDDLALPEVHRRTQLVIAQFRDAIRPIYRARRGGMPVHVGSCTLIRVGDTRLIVTAAHIIDQQERELWVAGMQRLPPLTRMFSGTVAPGNDRGLDRFDFSVSPVDEELADGLATSRRSTSARVAGKIESGRCTPASASRILRTRSGAKSRCGCGHILARDPRQRARGRGRSTAHLFIKFDKYAKTPEGIQRSSTEPRGVSGGPVFYLGDFGDPETYRAGADFQPMLEGIVIERRRRAKVLIAVKVAAIIETMRRAGRLGIK